MLKNAIPFALVFGVLACAVPQRPAEPPSSDLDSLKAEVRKLQESVAHLDNRLGHLQSEVSAASAEDELTTMTIDSVSWADASTAQVFGSTNSIACHVVEWRGYGKMLRFTRTADPRFVLEADGHEPVEGRIATGGICSSDGDTRAVVLVLSKQLDHGVRYRLTPKNESDKYHWSVIDGLGVWPEGPGHHGSSDGRQLGSSGG